MDRIIHLAGILDEHQSKVSPEVYAMTTFTTVSADWQTTERVSKTTPSLQVAVNPFFRRGNIIGENAYKTLRELGTDYVRYIPWLPYPKLVVAELEPPTNTTTSWDFSLIDPMTIDFFEATNGHPVVLNFSTIPQWMWRTAKPVEYPANPNEATNSYTQGTEPRDPTFKEIAGYYARLLSWYTQGGFVDEIGRRHESGHHYSVPFWGVLNEPDIEHAMTPEIYTKLYDQVVLAMRKVQPDLKFVGMSLAYPSMNPRFFEYFLDRNNHEPGIPLDYIAYHFYAGPTPEESPEVHGYTFFNQAEKFLTTVRYVENIRSRLSPETRTMIGEIGAFHSQEAPWPPPVDATAPPIPDSHWYLSGALYAYLFGELSRMGIDVVKASMLLAGEPRQHPISLLDWTTGEPNPRFRVLQLLHHYFSAGDRIVALDQGRHHPYVYALPVVTKGGERRLLLVNKSQHPQKIHVPGSSGGQKVWVDQTTASAPPAIAKTTSDIIALEGYTVAAITFPDRH
ncbi:glycosyl hydrolase family 39 [Mesorhizobium sp. M4B.F.Ca.ET.089.01.1.1]|uniref:GH39 family glycosyl hydrolase n=1 Tax=unclassified Mesorhizobium TaxID=325217 RepID=UPI000FE38C6C|nr:MULTISPECIES: glycosyl hydrolase family 39 [unclassified Mesorhizobium]RWX60187.1 glycosyl hydrolase family 39 [Mesorhizobium sp. M4B.F.Ca.ET.089.01.1.1]TIX21443.1 MAG: glycosyl hydrolase family 39 [Mesorhizobium sp.]